MFIILVLETVLAYLLHEKIADSNSKNQTENFPFQQPTTYYHNNKKCCILLKTKSQVADCGWLFWVAVIIRVSFFTSHLCQVSQDGKSLLDKLQRPLTPGSTDSLMASANYSKAVHHVLDIIHEVLHHQRQLENIWQHRKVRLHQRLQLCVFQQDVQQVSNTHIIR